MRNRLTLAFVSVAAFTLISGSMSQTASAADASGTDAGSSRVASVSPRLGEPTLTIQPNYDGNTRLSFGTLEWDDALASYTPSLTEVASGRAIPMGFGYASSIGTSDLEGPYEVPTTEPLVVGALYEAMLTVRTVGYWHCSIYDPDGCSWYDAETTTSRYRFTWSGAKMTGSVYVPPPPPPPPPAPKAATRIEVTPKAKWGPRGWKVTATTFRDTARGARLTLVGQWRTNSGWRVDDSWRTDEYGKLRIKFKGEKKRTRYRFVFEGDDTSLPSTSKVFFITGRG